MERAHLGKWTLVLEPAGGPNAPLLSARTDLELVASLFRQLFNRAMESMSTPATASIPIVLRGEFDRGLAGRMTPASCSPPRARPGSSLRRTSPAASRTAVSANPA